MLSLRAQRSNLDGARATGSRLRRRSAPRKDTDVCLGSRSRKPLDPCMPERSSPRVAILGFSIECNKFAPVATKAHFLARTYLEGDAIVDDARSPTPRMLPETPGFIGAMDASGAWTPVGIALAMTEPNGPVEHVFFVELLDTIERRLTAALPVDAVYICSHGAGLTTEEDDPDGMLFETVRQIVGPGVPIAATLDLHANVSERMVQSIDVFI